MTPVRYLSIAAGAFFFLSATSPAWADGPHRRARLSADLSDALATGSPSLDVIVHGDKATVDQAAARYNVKVKRYLKQGAVIHMNAGQLAAFRDDGTFDHLSNDVHIYSSDVTTETLEADRVWAGEGDLRPLIGRGVGVAVIDSGIDPQHAALRNRVDVSVDFTGGNGVDRFGHGTHVAAIIAGQQGHAADTRDYRGVASGARIINLRVLGDDGSGMASSVIQAIDWAIDNRDRYDIRVINLSLGAPVTQPYRDDPLCEAAERAVAAGIVVVTAAGNLGQTRDGALVYGSITSPGNDPSVVTVGALDAHATAERADDSVARYSSRGPTAFDLVMKPDLVAPGSHVVSAEAPGSYLATKYPERHVAGLGEASYFELSGTSMAAAVVSGAVAVLVGEEPSISPSDAKVVLQATSSFMPGAGLLAGGAGSIDLYAAAELLRGSYRAALDPGADRDALTSTSPASQGTLIARLAGDTATTAKAQTVVFGTTTLRGRSVVWGRTFVQGKTFVWGQPASRSRGTGKAVVKGQSDDGDTIVWGSSDDGDTIVWGSSDDGDTIVWGSSDDGDTIVWGSSDDGDTIVWGSSDDGDTIVWGE